MEENALATFQGSIIRITPSHLEVKPLAGSCESKPIMLDLEQSPPGKENAQEIRIPLSLIRNTRSKAFEIGQQIFLRYLKKDVISDKNVFIASTQKNNPYLEKDFQKNSTSFKTLAKRDQWTVPDIREKPDTFVHNIDKKSEQAKLVKKTAHLQANMKNVSPPISNETVKWKISKSIEDNNLYASEHKQPLTYLRGVNIEKGSAAELYNPSEKETIGKQIKVHMKVMQHLKENIDTYIASWFTLHEGSDSILLDIKKHIEEELKYFENSTHFTMSHLYEEDYATRSSPTIDENFEDFLCNARECMDLVTNLRRVLSHITIYHFTLLHHKTAIQYMNSYYKGLKDFYLPLRSADKEYSILRHEIVDSIRKELLLHHTKTSMKRSARIQEVLDNHSRKIFEVFEYEKSQRNNGSLNDWISDDNAINNFFSCPKRDKSGITSIIEKIQKEPVSIEKSPERASTIRSTRQDLEIKLFEMTLGESMNILSVPWLSQKDEGLCLLLKRYIDVYHSLLKKRKTLSCNWEHITSNAESINAIDQSMTSTFESMKTIKNIVKFTRLENKRHSAELQFIEKHLLRVSNTQALHRYGKSIKIDNKDNGLDYPQPHSHLQWQDSMHGNITRQMSNGTYYAEFMSRKRVDNMVSWAFNLKQQLRTTEKHLNKFINNVIVKPVPCSIEELNKPLATPDSTDISIQQLMKDMESKNEELNKLRKLSFAYVAYNEKNIS